MLKLKYSLLLLVLLLTVSAVSAQSPQDVSFGEGQNGYALSSNQSIVIDDDNFDSYFDSEGHIVNSQISKNSTIYLGDIYNRNIILNTPLTLTSYNSSSVLYNTSIKILDEGSGSVIKNLNFNFSLSENKNAPIYVDTSFDNVIENNIISVNFNDDSYYNVCGIYIAGESSNNVLSFNRITISSKSRSPHYVYGIQLSASPMGQFVSTYNPEDNIVKSNIINIDGGYYASGIYLSSTINTGVSDNNIVIDSNAFAYGVVCEYNPLSQLTLPSYNINITNNIITATSSMVYLIEIYNCYDVNVISNIVTGIGNASYGICGYKTHDNIVDNNTIFVNGSDISLISDNFDVISSGHCGISYMKNSYNINITNNRVLSFYELGGDYSIICDASCTNISIYNNRLTSNNNTYHGNDSILAEADIFNNTYFSYDFVSYTDYTIVPIYVNNNYYGDGSKNNPFNSINDALLYLKNLNIQNSAANYKGIIYISEGTYDGFNKNLRLYITDLNVELIGVYNKTIIDASNNHWFFDISRNSEVKISNITFINGLLRNSNSGLIVNNGQLSISNCIFLSSRIVDDSGVIYNKGILKLSNNKMNLSNVKNYIYNNGRIENVYLNFICDSLDENDRIITINSSYAELPAYLHDDSGNPISGGYVNFFVESKSIPDSVYVSRGIAKLKLLISSFNDTLRVSGSYSNSYGNVFINIGYVKNDAVNDNYIFYVNSSALNGDGSKNNPFSSIEDALGVVRGAMVDDTEREVILYLVDGNYPKIDINDFSKPIRIIGSENTNILANSHFKSNYFIYLSNLRFDGASISNNNTTLFVDNCIFKNAEVNAIHSSNSNLTVSNSLFTNNGKAEFNSNSITLPISNMNIFNLGGAIKNENGDLTISNSQFIANEAVFGGAIYNKQGNLYIFDSLFKDNLAASGFGTLAPESLGGGIYQYLGSEIIVSNTTFEENTANGHGGAFYSSGSRPRALQLNDDSSAYMLTFWMREYLNLENSPQNIYFVNCNFTKNMAPSGGGAVYITDNLLTQYIGCTFDSNVVYSHNWYNEIGLAPRQTWSSSISPLMLSKTDNLGGAISDNNLIILDSTFKANTAEHGGAIIVPSVASSTAELSGLPRDSVGVSFESRGVESQSVYVADSSLLTSEDSRFLGISGWSGTYDGPSISRYIPEYSQNYNRPSLPSNLNGDGSGGNGNSHVDFSANGQNQGGNSNTGQGHLSMNDIYNMLGSLSGDNIVYNNGNIDISSLLGNLNGVDDGEYYDEMEDVNSNNTHESSDEIPVNGTTNNDDSSGSQSDNGGDASSVGESLDELTGVISNNNHDASDTQDSSESSSSSSQSAGPSSKAYEISKSIDSPQNVLSSEITAWAVILVVILLLGLGYYRKRDNE